nr:hypothetical protein 19 [bacterium]
MERKNLMPLVLASLMLALAMPSAQAAQPGTPSGSAFLTGGPGFLGLPLLSAIGLGTVGQWHITATVTGDIPVEQRLNAAFYYNTASPKSWREQTCSDVIDVATCGVKGSITKINEWEAAFVSPNGNTLAGPSSGGVVYDTGQRVNPGQGIDLTLEAKAPANDAYTGASFPLVVIYQDDITDTILDCACDTVTLHQPTGEVNLEFLQFIAAGTGTLLSILGLALIAL